MSGSDWNAGQYLVFETERTRAAIDLLARVPAGERRAIVDLGCGPGNSTRLLVDRFAAGEIVGIDTSDAMLDAARASLPGVRFVRAAVENWRSDSEADLIFANAVLQWVPGHLRVMTDLMGQLAPEGCLAVQMPDNFDEPSHVLMRELARRPPFRDKFAKAELAREPIATFQGYYEALAPLCESVDIWRTTYVHRLAGPDTIVEWVKGTGLRPFLDPLSADERADFLEQYRAEITKAYPPLANGEVLLPFPGLFIVAARGHG